MRHITAYCKKVRLLCSEEAKILIKSAPRLHPKLMANIIDIRQYNVEFEPTPTNPFPHELLLDSVDEWDSLDEPQQEAPDIILN
jgi:hypothetical protein